MRKTAILTIGLACFTFVSNAQISKGSLYLGGSIGYSKTSEERTATSPTIPNTGELKNLVVSPAIGIAVKQNFIAGINFNYGKGTQNYFAGNNSKYDSKVVGGGVFLRRYYPVATRFYAYGELGAGYANVSNTQESNYGTGIFTGYQSKGWSVGASVSPGITYNVTKALFLEMEFANLLQLSYGKATQTEKSSPTATPYVTTRKSFDFNTSLTSSSNLNVGVRFIIPKK